MVQLYTNQTAGSGVTPSASVVKTVFASAVVPYKGQQKIRVTVIVGIDSVTTPVGQTNPMVITVGATTKTFSIKATAAELTNRTETFIWDINCASSTTVKVELGLAPADDVDTTVTGLYLNVESIDP